MDGSGIVAIMLAHAKLKAREKCYGYENIFESMLFKLAFKLGQHPPLVDLQPQLKRDSLNRRHRRIRFS